MAFRKVLLLQSQKLKKKGSWIAVHRGAFKPVCLHVCLSYSGGIVRRDRVTTETANCKTLTVSHYCLQYTSFTSAKNSKVGITV